MTVYGAPDGPRVRTVNRKSLVSPTAVPDGQSRLVSATSVNHWLSRMTCSYGAVRK
jgi:hypothetical protein